MASPCGSALVAAAVAFTGLVSFTGVRVAAADTTPVVNAGDVSVVEGDSGNAVVKMPVDLSIPPAARVKVPYSIVPVSNGDGSDVVLRSGYVTFAMGVATKAVNVSVVGDTSDENDQRFSVRLGAPIGPAVMGDSDGELVVVDDDADGSSAPLEASVGSVQIEEADGGAHVAYIPITLNHPAPTKVQVSFLLDCSTASLIADVSIKKSGRVTFQAGQRSKVIPFKITADTRTEDIEKFAESIRASFGPLTILADTGTTEIIDDDGVFQGYGHGLPAFAPEPLPAPSGFNAGAVGDVEQVSVASDGTPAHYPVPAYGDGRRRSHFSAMSSDGSVIVFASDADNLVPGDTNGMSDLFVRDRAAGTTERVSVNADGSEITPTEVGTLKAWGASGIWRPAISANGRYVAYTTSTPLVSTDPNVGSWIGLQDVYLYDRVTHAVELVSAMPDGTAAGGVFNAPSVSADGRYVTFEVKADSTRLDSGNGTLVAAYSRAYVRDRLIGTTQLVYDGPGQQPVISADGRSVVVVAGGPVCPIGLQLLVVDLGTGATDRIDVRNDGTGAAEGDFADLVFMPSISADGRYVSFKSFAWNLIPGMLGPLQSPISGAFPMELVHAYVRDRVAKTTTIVGNFVGWAPQNDIYYADRPAITDDGRFVAVGQVVGGGLRLNDRQTGTASGYAIGQSYALYESHPLSADGHYAAYSTDVSLYGDVFVERVG